MDITLIRTFLQVAATGSFGAAAERLFVTQSAVSLRVQRLEDQLGRTLFTRSKTGAELTPAGHAFEPYALRFIQTWERARQQIAVPEGFTQAVSLGAQYSLWPRLGFRLIDGLRTHLPHLSIRAELGMPDRLTGLLVEGSIQIALMYTPTLRPGLRVERLMEEELILVASRPDRGMDDLAGRYAFVDWGPEFVTWHAARLPDLTNPGLTLALGALSAEFISRRDFAAYIPARSALRYVDNGQLHLIDVAPVFPYPVYLVWREDLPPEVVDTAHRVLAEVIAAIDEDVHDMVDEDDAPFSAE